MGRLHATGQCYKVCIPPEEEAFASKACLFVLFLVSKATENETDREVIKTELLNCIFMQQDSCYRTVCTIQSVLFF